jgi:predicted dehydrogenase
MKVAVLGCGGMGRLHASMYARIDGVQVTAVCDEDADCAQTLADLAGAQCFQSFERMLAEADFEAVSITLPSYLHKPYTLQAARAGKHVICEKPIALNLEDADEMIRCCEENGVRLFVGHVVRFFPEYVHMKQDVDQGKIGRPGVAHAKRGGPHPGNARPWFKAFDKSGGVIIDLMIHDLDYLRWTFGEVSSLYAMQHSDANIDYALVTLQFENGAIANVEANWGYPGPFHTKAEIAGSGGVVIADSLKSASLHIHKASPANAASPFVAVPESPGFHSPYELELGHFVVCIRNNEEAKVTPQDAYKALAIALAAVDSARSGKAIHFREGRPHA